MSTQSEAGKQAWARRATGYPDELRGQIERDTAATVAAWDVRGRRPAWFRIKMRLMANR